MKHLNTKHIEIKYDVIKDIIQKRKIELLYIPTTNQLTEFLNKPMDEQTILKLTTDLRMLALEWIL